MNEEVEQVVEAVEQEAVPVDQAASDLRAGFNRVRGITDETAEKAVVEVAPPAEVEPVVEPLSQDELRAAMSKLPELEQFKGHTAEEMRKLHGKMGEFNQRLQQFQAAPTAANSEAQKEAMQRLSEDYPELAQAMKPLFEGRSGPSVSQEQVAAIVREQVGQAQAQTTQTITELRAELELTTAHPDWKSALNTPEFAKWMATKPADYQAMATSSWDINGVVAPALTEFKAWKNTTYVKSREKQARLEAAATPTGVPSRTQAKLPDSAGLNVGFNRIRKQA